jgi:hypothetical protein
MLAWGSEGNGTMADSDLTPQETTRALLYVIQYCKELMTEHMAIEYTLREQHGWLPTYRSYLSQATIATEAAFREIEQALAARTGIGHALEHFAPLYPVKPQSVQR